jgi:hypothetical protein
MEFNVQKITVFGQYTERFCYLSSLCPLFFVRRVVKVKDPTWVLGLYEMILPHHIRNQARI